ncbi:hypothetical protein KPL35_07960 [Clostridium sp. CF011]|uniref:hypothetical protein n=1 Tax=Clostridium sp. CF011 TaxID=2843318 RepID=UPI001C0D6F2F|nr:hypothetical protein [Clostridium sp. CF011]MBU3092012.1 hypothetical protein [Clostridium sp. CF011]WAG71298.1 hypothetical protein LL036_07800 [Clostridium sp. CF011]
MENVKKPKVGAGIKTMSIIQLIVSVFGLSSIKNFSKKDELNAANKAAGELLNMVLPEVTNLSITIGLVFSIILAISVILILMKKELGIYIYFIATVAQIAYTIVNNGFNPWMLAALIMPALMGFFIWKKREIFSTDTKTEQIDV